MFFLCFTFLYYTFSIFLLFCVLSFYVLSLTLISESFYKGTISQRNYRKMPIEWSFSYNSFVKFHINKILEAIVLYPNPYYNKVCYKGTALYTALIRLS